jgi:DNA-binding transcriptional LysR family regulator
MNIAWEDMRVFLAVAETGNMSEAARQLRVGQPTVSRRLALLEAQLGYALFRRTVSGASLTAAGERMVAPARKMAEWAGEVNRAAGSQESRPHGIVRLAVPPIVAWELATPFAAWLRTKQPLVQLELLCGIGYLDLARGEADLALRMKPATTADLTTVAELRHRNHVVAAKELVARLPKKHGPADVPWVAWAPPFDALPPNPQLERLIPGFRPSFTSDNPLILRQAAEAGLGAIVVADVRHRFLRPTSLVPLPQLALGEFAESSVYLVCAKSALDIPRVRVVAELLAEELKRAR